MNPINIQIGQILKEKRLEKNITQLEVANYLGYDSTQFVSLFERSLSKVPIPVLGKLCDFYGIPKNKIIKMITRDFENEIRKQMGAE